MSLVNNYLSIITSGRTTTLCCAYKSEIAYERNKDEQKCFIKRKFKPTCRPEDAILTHRSVLVHGESGIGKTTYASDIEHQWANGNILTDMFVLTYTCRDVNCTIRKNIYVAPLYFSNAKCFLADQNKDISEGCITMYQQLESLAKEKKLVLLIDGIDEVSLDNQLLKTNREILERKIENGEAIDGLETLVGIMLGKIFHSSRIIVFGRKQEIDKLLQIDNIKSSNVFCDKERKVLELKRFSKRDVMSLTCERVCGINRNHIRVICDDNDAMSDDIDNYYCFLSNSKCRQVYELFKDVDFKTIPSFCFHLIDLFKDDEWLERIGKKTKTKILITIIFNHISNCMELEGEELTYHSLGESFACKGLKYKECLKHLMDVSYQGLLCDKVKIIGEKDGDNYIFNGFQLNREDCSKLNMFYSRTDNYETSIEPRHVIMMEFLCACYFSFHKERWDDILLMSKSRQYVIIPFIAGLLKSDKLTKVFLAKTLDVTYTSCLEEYLEWLFQCDWNKLPQFSNTWHCLNDDGSMLAMKLIHNIVQETKIPDIDLLPTTLQYDGGCVEDLFYMKYAASCYDFNGKSEKNIITYCESYPMDKIFVNSNYLDVNNDDITKLQMMRDIPQIQIEINDIYLGEDVNDVDNLDIPLSLPFKQLHMNGGHRFVNQIIQTFSYVYAARKSSSCREINMCEPHKLEIECFDNLLTASLLVDCLRLSYGNFNDDQWNAIERLIINNTVYNDVRMVLSGCNVNEECIKVLSKFNYVGLNNLRKLDDDALRCLVKLSGRNQEMDTHDDDWTKTFILYQFEIEHTCHFYRRINANPILSGGDNGMLMFYLYNMVLKNIPVEVLVDAFTSIPCVVLSNVVLTKEQWKRFTECMYEGTVLLRELRLSYNADEFPWDQLISLSKSPLTLLQIIPNDYRREMNVKMTIRIMKHFLKNRIERMFRVVAYGGEGISYIEHVVHEGNMSSLTNERNVKKIENKMNIETYENFSWMFELTYGVKDKCEIM